jgi:hypothetical protein
MTDPILDRARLAIEESRRLQALSRYLRATFDREREALRMSVLESAMCRAETKAYRDDKE